MHPLGHSHKTPSASTPPPESKAGKFRGPVTSSQKRTATTFARTATSPSPSPKPEPRLLFAKTSDIAVPEAKETGLAPKKETSLAEKSSRETGLKLPEEKPTSLAEKSSRETRLKLPEEKPTGIEPQKSQALATTGTFQAERERANYDSRGSYGGSKDSRDAGSKRFFDPNRPPRFVTQLVNPRPIPTGPTRNVASEAGETKETKKTRELAEAFDMSKFVRDLLGENYARNEDNIMFLLKILVALVTAMSDETYTTGDMQADLHDALKEIYEQYEHIFKEFEENYQEEMKLISNLRSIVISDPSLPVSERVELLAMLQEVESDWKQQHEHRIKINDAIKEWMNLPANQYMDEAVAKKIRAFVGIMITDLVTTRVTKLLKSNPSMLQREAGKIAATAPLAWLFNQAATPRELEEEIAKTMKLFDPNSENLSEDHAKLVEASTMMAKSALSQIVGKVMKQKPLARGNLTTKFLEEFQKEFVKKELDKALPTKRTQKEVKSLIEELLKPALKERFQTLHENTREQHELNLQLAGALKKHIDVKINKAQWDNSLLYKLYNRLFTNNAYNQEPTKVSAEATRLMQRLK